MVEQERPTAHPEPVEGPRKSSAAGENRRHFVSPAKAGLHVGFVIQSRFFEILLDSGLRRNDGENPLSHAWERVRVRATVLGRSFCNFQVSFGWILAFAGMTDGGKMTLFKAVPGEPVEPPLG